jgi:hypothetical protein
VLIADPRQDLLIAHPSGCCGSPTSALTTANHEQRTVQSDGRQ